MTPEMKPVLRQDDASGVASGGDAPRRTARQIDAESAAQPIYERLRADILQDVYTPGAHLVEWNLAKSFGVSRTPVRVALARLEGDGLVETIPNRGAFVSNWANVDFDEVYMLRIRLEPLASRLAAERISDTELDRLESLATQMIDALEAGQADWVDQCTRLNADLHDGILAACGSTRLASMVRSLTELMVVRRSISLYPHSMLRRNFEQHFQILQALRQRDAEWAEALMTAHIMGGRQAIARHYQKA